MIKIKIVAIGKVKEDYFLKGIEEYSKRLQKFCEFEIVEVKEVNYKNPTTAEIEQIIKKESELISSHLTGAVVAMAIEGKLLSTSDLKDYIDKKSVSGQSEITFVIGGSYGLDENIKNRATDKISLSKMTFPHTMARLILTEQIYRAFTIMNNLTYHK